MKLALYLPNFRDSVTVKELEDLTQLAEDLDFDSVWTLDRIVVPEASDREELVHSFGMMDGFPKQLPVSARGSGIRAGRSSRGSRRRRRRYASA
jgi:FMNH2-dependent dimethyl sulfone monooxygenase